MRNLTYPGRAGLGRTILPAVAVLLFVVSCAPPVPRPTGAAADFDDAKVMFKRGRFDRAVGFTDNLVTASPPNKFTEKARVLRAVILVGEIKAYKSLAEAYSKGVDTTQNSHFKAAYEQQRHDNLQLGGKRALDLGEVALRLTQGGVLPKELVLEASYPDIEGPVEVKELLRVSEGGWVEPDRQEAAAVDTLRKGVDDSLAEVMGGDRSKARAALSAGPVKLDSVDFGLYLVRMVFEGASLFDRKHFRDSQKFKTLLNVGDGVTKAVSAMLKEKPDKEKEAKVKNLQGQIKAALRAV